MQNCQVINVDLFLTGSLLAHLRQRQSVKIKPPNQRKLTVSDRKTGKIFN
jgi:hypothetical protein